jgi:sodium-dependent dicarboxylate transporter 2/3/5
VTLPWGIVLLLGGGFALADSVAKSGLSCWLGNQLTFLSSWPPLLVLLIICTFMTFATEYVT